MCSFLVEPAHFRCLGLAAPWKQLFAPHPRVCLLFALLLHVPATAAGWCVSSRTVSPAYFAGILCGSLLGAQHRKDGGLQSQIGIRFPL